MPGDGDDSLIHAIYEAALQPCLFHPLLDRLVRSFHAHTGLIVEGDLRAATAQLLAGHGVDPEIHKRFFSEYLLNPWTLAMLGQRMPEAVATDCLVPLQEIKRTAFYADVVRPAQLHHGMGMFYPVDGSARVPRGAVGHVAVQRGPRRGPFGRDDCDRLTSLAPHFLRAAQVRRRLDGLDAQRAAAMDAVEILATPVVLVDAKCRVAFANAGARALLARNDGLAVDHGALSAASPAKTTELGKTIADAAATGAGTPIGAGGVLLLPRPSGARPLVATVAPLRGHALGSAVQRPAAAVFLADPERGVSSGVAHALRLYGLTEAETRLALLIADGGGLSRAAEALGVGRNTAHTHLQRAMEKTGTRRQAELARLVELLATHRPRPR
ncbi:MAG: helix-turn-helix transcriptional regulator [Deltaproteobacteria bacterium]|nr:helix-turn-helix transcriptional regulator [Deltaproteobacteria bacterium]